MERKLFCNFLNELLWQKKYFVRNLGKCWVLWMDFYLPKGIYSQHNLWLTQNCECWKWWSNEFKVAFNCDITKQIFYLKSKINALEIKIGQVSIMRLESDPFMFTFADSFQFIVVVDSSLLYNQSSLISFSKALETKVRIQPQ